MPKKMFPYNQKGREGTSPWLWAWDVPRSKGTGTPYVVSVRDFTSPDGTGEVIWGCNCAAGRNGHPSCQHRMRVRYEIVTVPNMLANLPMKVREIVAPNFSALPTKSRAVQATTDTSMDDQIRALKVVN